MNWISQFFKRQELYDALSEEIHEHLAEKTRELIESGLPEKEAALAARREFGNVTLIEERSRETWHWSFETLISDVRYGLRALRKNPTFTSIAILTLSDYQ